ncbi:type I secretion system permease/ATPase [Caulobacter sp. KR2-114]|uniref:type I secretion system permease/ATPase n=1 Tax=Caulobacter sp. KR2-114 TaxID=3400912 RepID=UPI003C08D8B0
MAKQTATSLTSPLRQALQACRRHFWGAAAFSALLNLLYLAPTLYMLLVYDRVVPSRGGMTLVFITIALVAALATLSLLDMVRTRLLTRAGQRLDRLLAPVILSATLARARGGKDVISRQAMREFDTLRQALSGAGVLALFDAPWTPIYLIVCALLHPLLGAVALFGAASLVGLAWLNERATRERLAQSSAAANLAYVSQEQSAAGNEVVRALGMRQAMIRRHMGERESAMRLQTEAAFAGGGYMALTRFARTFLQSLALGIGAWLAINQKISPGSIFAASLLVGRALAPIEQVLGAWRQGVQARVAWRTLNDLLARAPAEIGLTHLPDPTGVVDLERVLVLNAARDGAVLQQITLHMDAGEIVGVIGPSGAGKSTLLRVIAGAIDADQGAVRFDGAERADWEAERLASHIGYMPQDASLFAGTVKDNIARFRTGDDPKAIDAMAIAAAQAAGAHEMILRLADGYDTQLGWGGSGLSAGQAQKIALARALFGDPAILLLDEPNAHLDLEGEAQLLATLQALKARGRTVIVVAHRTGVLSAVDKLMMLRDGRIELYGPRDEVIVRINGPRPQLEAQPPAAEAAAPPAPPRRAGSTPQRPAADFTRRSPVTGQ